jgi:leader peptidase (prepilin peptidase)/N-methyltransferase
MTTTTMDTSTASDVDDVDHSQPAKRTLTSCAVALTATVLLGGGLAIAALSLPDAVWPVAALRIILATAPVVGGVWLAIIDSREHRLPNAIIYPLGIVTIGLTVALAIATGQPAQLLLAPLSGLALGAFYFLLGLLGAVGFGDVKLAIIIGISLSWFDWPALVAATVLAYVLAIPHAVVLAIRKHSRGLTVRLPFGPYMIAGALVTAAWWMLR